MMPEVLGHLHFSWSQTWSLKSHTVLSLFLRADQAGVSRYQPTGQQFAQVVYVHFSTYFRSPVCMTSASKLHILPGKIIHEKKSYNQVIDYRQNSEPHGSTYAVEFASRDASCWQRQIFVRESSTSLEIRLDFQDLDRMNHKVLHTISVGPRHLSGQLNACRGLVHCRRLHSRIRSDVDCKWSGPIAKDDIRRAVRDRSPILWSGIKICVLQYRDVMSLISAVASTLHSSVCVVIVGHECLNCCLKAVLAMKPRRGHEFCIMRL